MILADTSIWIDHLNVRDDDFAELLARELILAHPFVIGEIALGNLRDRAAVYETLFALRQVVIAKNNEVLALIDRAELYGLGLGYVDVHLLASAKLTGHARLWTRDKRLAAAAERLGCAAPPFTPRRSS